MQPPYKDRDWLYKHYIILQESTHVMAKKADCGQTTVWYWLHKFEIPARTPGEGIFLATRNYLNFSEELSNLLEGELLGDGSVVMNGSRSALYSHSSKYREYLAWLSKTFTDLELEQSGKINYRGPTPLSPNGGYKYTSRSYPELVSIRQRWYSNGKKIVPKDLKLNPLICRQWYIGDGNLHNLTRWSPDIRFCTDDFDKLSIDHLLKELRDNGFKVSHQPSENRIGMSVKSIRDFLHWIGPCPEVIQNIYGYKWEALNAKIR